MTILIIIYKCMSKIIRLIIDIIFIIYINNTYVDNRIIKYRFNKDT